MGPTHDMFISSYIMLDHWSVIALHLLYSHTDRYFHFYSHTDRYFHFYSHTDRYFHFSDRQIDRDREPERETSIPDARKPSTKKFIPIIQVTSLKTKNTPTII